MGVLVAILTLVKDGKPTVQIGYFPHASLALALELTNLGAVGVTVQKIVISSDLSTDPPSEPYPVSVALLPSERKILSIYPEVRQYFDAHMRALYETGTESRRPAVRIFLKYEALKKEFRTNVLTLEGQFNGHIIVDLRPRP